ncbi:glycosyltransferase [Escherichia coli]|nr:glycosyltransferase [Escherichia coli]
MFKFSVLMSVYYKEKPAYLDEALNSLAIQTYKADEIVLVIDAQIPIQLKNVIDKWLLLLPIKTIPLEKNVGLGNALNIGLNYVTNKLVARMDTDDICVPERFEKQISYFQKNPSTIILGGAIDEYDETFKDRRGRRFSCCSHSDIVSYSLFRNPFNHMTVMFNKEFILGIGGYKHHHYMEDYNLWLRCIANGAICSNIDNTLVLARTGDAMIERRRGRDYLKSEIELARLKIKCFPNKKAKIILITFSRLIVRILPQQILSSVYKNIRKK